MKKNDWKSFYEQGAKMTQFNLTKNIGQHYSLCDAFNNLPSNLK